MLKANSDAESIRQIISSACYIHLYNGDDDVGLVLDGILDQQV